MNDVGARALAIRDHLVRLLAERSPGGVGVCEPTSAIAGNLLVVIKRGGASALLSRLSVSLTGAVPRTGDDRVFEMTWFEGHHAVRLFARGAWEERILSLHCLTPVARDAPAARL